MSSKLLKELQNSFKVFHEPEIKGEDLPWKPPNSHEFTCYPKWEYDSSTLSTISLIYTLLPICPETIFINKTLSKINYIE